MIKKDNKEWWILFLIPSVSTWLPECMHIYVHVYEPFVHISRYPGFISANLGFLKVALVHYM